MNLTTSTPYIRVRENIFTGVRFEYDNKTFITGDELVEYLVGREQSLKIKEAYENYE